jgi:hypothetical protein
MLMEVKGRTGLLVKEQKGSRGLPRPNSLSAAIKTLGSSASAPELAYRDLKSENKIGRAV